MKLPCPAGAYCPAGDVPTACPLGTWANLVGQECQLEGEGTLLHLNACPAGTWNNLTGQTNITSCQMCPPDMHCEVGSRTPSAHQQEFSEPQPGELCSSLSHKVHFTRCFIHILTAAKLVLGSGLVVIVLTLLCRLPGIRGCKLHRRFSTNLPHCSRWW